MSHDDFMRRAIALAEQAVHSGAGGPFGAVIVRAGRVVAEGSNRVTSTKDPTAHAEIVAIRAACEALDDHSLAGCTIYASCEPCPMCLAAIYWARLDALFYGNSRHDAAAIGFDDDHIYEQLARPLHAGAVPATRHLEAEAKAAFDAWLAKPDKTHY
jgi:guanine deaminase